MGIDKSFVSKCSRETVTILATTESSLSENMVNETQVSKMCPVTLKIRAARLKVGHNFRNLLVRNFFNKSGDYLCKVDINERSSIEFMTDRSVNDD